MPPIPQVTMDEFDGEYRDWQLIHSALDRWAAAKPDAAAIVNATRGTGLTWSELRRASLVVAAALARLGFRKGDFLAASLPMLDEHIVLEYACFRLGVVHAPLDLRLQPAEVLRSVAVIGAKGYAFPGKLLGVDFGALGEAVRQRCASVERLIQFAPADECVAGAIPIHELLSAPVPNAAPGVPIEPQDCAQVIFSTGSTGSPKPALLSHRGITCQNLCLAKAFGFTGDQRVLCNLPASHVGGQAEILMTTLFKGGTAVTLEVFDAVKSLDAIEQHGVTLIGQIPAMFQMEWRTAGYASRRLNGLRLAVYGGQSVPRPFLDRMLEMAPTIATGLGLTEASGFCTYTAMTGDADEVAAGTGWAMPVYPMTIREPMAADGSAGAEVANGEAGHICFRGPQTFLGYANDPDATASTLSRDRWLYTGDMGRVDERGLQFCGRAKWVLKPAGYQVFPGDVEAHIAALADCVGSVGVVGQPHAVWSEGIIAFVEKRPGAEISETDLRRHGRGLTSYMRPLHYVVMEPGTMPLNRAAKVDVKRLQELASEEVARLRERGRWDRGDDE